MRINANHNHDIELYTRLDSLVALKLVKRLPYFDFIFHVSVLPFFFKVFQKTFQFRKFRNKNIPAFLIFLKFDIRSDKSIRRIYAGRSWLITPFSFLRDLRKGRNHDFITKKVVRGGQKTKTLSKTSKNRHSIHFKIFNFQFWSYCRNKLARLTK